MTILIEVQGYDPRLNSRRESVNDVIEAILKHLRLVHEGGFNDKLNLGLKELTRELIGSNAGHEMVAGRAGDRNIGIGYVAPQTTDSGCDHGRDKRVYATTFSGGLQPWICSECGSRGRDQYEWKKDWSEYNKLVMKFHGSEKPDNKREL